MRTAVSSQSEYSGGRAWEYNALDWLDPMLPLNCTAMWSYRAGSGLPATTRTQAHKAGPPLSATKNYRECCLEPSEEFFFFFYQSDKWDYCALLSSWCPPFWTMLPACLTLCICLDPFFLPSLHFFGLFLLLLLFCFMLWFSVLLLLWLVLFSYSANHPEYCIVLMGHYIK